MNNIKKLAGGGDKEVEKMIEIAALIGTDMIEVLWIPENGGDRWSVARIMGFKHPVIGKTNPFGDEIKPDQWVDGILTFYPDNNGRCWGYIYDCQENRNLIYTSFSTGWFRIVDKKLREELIEEAKAKNIQTDRAIRTEVNTRKSVKEIDAEKKAQTLETKLFHMEEQMMKYKRELEEAKNIRMVHVDKRIKGTPIDAIDEEALVKGK